MTGVIRGVVGLCAAAMLVGSLALNPVFTSAVGGFVANKHEQESDKRFAEAREQTFRTICTDYFAASFLERWASRHISNGWCEDYKHRL